MTDESSQPMTTQTPKELWVSLHLDVMEALVNDTVDESLYIFDNNTAGGSQNQGTTVLKSVVNPGSTIYWGSRGLEVETDIVVHNITGPATEQFNFLAFSPELTLYVGHVSPDAPAGEYEYSIEMRVESKLMKLSTQLTLIVER